MYLFLHAEQAQKEIQLVKVGCQEKGMMETCWHLQHKPISGSKKEMDSG